MELLGDVGHVESRLVHLEMEFALVQGRCTVCTIRTIGSDIVLDAPNENSLVTWVMWNLVWSIWRWSLR